MGSHQLPARTRRRSAPTEARGPAAASGPRPEALLALLAIAALLMAVPALVAGISLLDPHALYAAQGLAQVSGWLSYPAHAGPILAVPLVTLVGRAKEDA
jgi:hypothetical protein